MDHYDQSVHVCWGYVMQWVCPRHVLDQGFGCPLYGVTQDACALVLVPEGRSSEECVCVWGVLWGVFPVTRICDESIAVVQC